MERSETLGMNAAHPNPAPESQAAVAGARPSATVLRYLKVLADRLIQLGAELKQSRQDLGSVEAALIARIADVDDERRRGETRIQRVLRTQRDELDASLRRQRVFMALLFLAISLLVGGSLGFIMLRLQTSQQAIEAQINELRKAIVQISLSVSSAADPQTRAQIERLSLTLSEISSALERRGGAMQELDLDLARVSAHTPIATPASSAPDTPVSDGQPPASQMDSDRQSTAAVASNTQSSADTASDHYISPQPSPNDQIAPETLPHTDTASSATPTKTPTEALPTPQVDAAILPTDTTSAPATDNRPLQQPSAETISPAPTLLDQSPTVGKDEPSPAAAEPSPRLARRIEVGERTFSVQLIGFNTLQALERFVADNPLPLVYYYREESYQGRPWFVLIHSLHPTREAAESAVASLPPQLARLNLWIRRLKPETKLIEVQRLRP